MKFIDLFAGLGGFHLAAKQFASECVFACEISPVLNSLYEKNFCITPSGDIRNIDPKQDIPNHDLLCAGFPCQPFSKAGDQMGWRDASRGTVFFNIVEILQYHRPKFIILENVAHFIRHDDGNTYQKVIRALEKIGYEVKSRTLSPHLFGVPQIRERMYLVGQYGGLNGFRWPEPFTTKDDLRLHKLLDTNPSEAKRLSEQVVSSLDTWQCFLKLIPKEDKLPSFPIWSMEFGATYPYNVDSLSSVPLKKLRKAKGSFGQSLNKWYRKDIIDLVPTYAQGEKNAFPKWKKKFIKDNRDFYKKYQKKLSPWLKQIKQFPPSYQKFEWNCQGVERNIWKLIIQFRSSGVRVKRATTSPSLIAMTETQIPIVGWEKRYMTVKERARLQSMEGLTHLPNESVAVSALGNAVNVKVASLILQNLLPPN